MNEIFDKLLIRIIFTVFLCIALIIYKYAHTIFYPSARKQVLRKIYPLENPADTLHLFSRLIGIAIIFSALEFNEYTGISFSIFHFFTWSTISFIIYLISLYITDSIIFSKFEYIDEILKKVNYSYAIIAFTNSIALAFIIKKILKESEFNFILFLVFWLFALTLYGAITKLYKYISKISFNKFLRAQDVSLGFSYMGFLLGSTIILTSSFVHEHHDITTYLVQVLLKVLLAALIVPIFKHGIMIIFKINVEDITYPESSPTLGLGIYEGAIFLTCGFLTSIITSQIHFGSIYPIF